jgi:hypothetical protein
MINVRILCAARAASCGVEPQPTCTVCIYVVQHQECPSQEHSHLFGWHGVVVLSCAVTIN